jgi:peptidoglycan/LPS O-acetylase OafA/YrhL
MGLENTHQAVDMVDVPQAEPNFAKLHPSKSLHSPLERLLHLDGLRGLAVLLVFFVHLHPLFSGFLKQNSFLFSFSNSLASIGNAGVDLFFLVSGYLIYGVVLKHAHTYRSFLWRRIHRIYPTFIVVFLLYLILSFIFPSESKLSGSTAEKVEYIAANFFLLPGVFPIKPIITVAWSLSYEFFFYLAIPLIVHMARFRKMSSGHKAVVFAVWWVVGTIGLRFLGLQRLQMFAVGILIYELGQLKAFTKGLSAVGEYVAALAFIFGLICAYFLFVPTSELITMRDSARYLAFPLMSASFFLFGTYALLYSGFLRTLLNWIPLRFLGRVSYSYYLIHGLTLKTLAFIITAVHVRWVGTTAFCIVSLIGFALTYLNATLLYLMVEEPLSLHTESTLLRWWHWCTRGATGRTAAGAKAAVAANSGAPVSQE